MAELDDYKAAASAMAQSFNAQTGNSVREAAGTISNPDAPGEIGEDCISYSLTLRDDGTLYIYVDSPYGDEGVVAQLTIDMTNGEVE